jgi:predicted GIY-YIG superfamily endonuclease
MAVEGTVYLLHFERAYYGQMRHYVGFTADDLDQRLERHREGKGGKTTRRAFDKGISFTLARTWPGSLSLERQIKSNGPVNYCPLCPRRNSGSSPSNLIGANALAGEGHSQG